MSTRGILGQSVFPVSLNSKRTDRNPNSKFRFLRKSHRFFCHFYFTKIILVAVGDGLEDSSKHSEFNNVLKIVNILCKLQYDDVVILTIIT